MERTFLCVDLHLLDAYPYLTGGPPFLQHELCIGIIHPTDFVIEPKFLSRLCGGQRLNQTMTTTEGFLSRLCGGQP